MLLPRARAILSRDAMVAAASILYALAAAARAARHRGYGKLVTMSRHRHRVLIAR